MIVVSTLSEENYNIYASRTIPTWLNFFPLETEFHIHCDFDMPIQDPRIKYFKSSDQKISFLNRNNNLNRSLPLQTKGYATRWDTYCHKVFAQCETALMSNEGIMIFIDADVALLKNIDEATIREFLKDSFCSFVARESQGTETGLIFYNLDLDQEKSFFNELLNIYILDKIFEFPQWDDCFVFDQVRQQSTLEFSSMSRGYEKFIDPISVGPLGEYFDHWIGKLSKVRGYSKHRKFIGRI